MKKESIKIIIYEKDNKTRVKLKNKNCKYASDGVKNLHTMLRYKISDILNKIDKE